MDLLGAYLSDDDSAPPHAIMMVDPIYDLKQSVVETGDRLVPIAVNLMFELEKRAPSLPRYVKIGVVVQTLETYPQLNDSKFLHYALVKDLYRLAETNNLLIIQRRERRCCWC